MKITPDEIIRMAREADTGPELFSFPIEFLERFAALVAAAEREACAKVCIDLPSPADIPEGEGWWDVGCVDCATAIRARGATTDCCKGGPQWGHAWDCPTLP